MSNQLTVVERGSLRKLEATIEKGMATFIEVGIALKTIRDEQLYRESHKTFEKYVAERWGMARQRAYQLIDAAEVKADLSTIVDKTPKAAEIIKETQLRELVTVPTENLSEVIDRAAEIAGDSPIRARDLHEAKLELYGDKDPAAVALIDEPGPARKTAAQLKNDEFLQGCRERLDKSLRNVILQFGHLGLGGQADNEVKALRRKAGI